MVYVYNDSLFCFPKLIVMFLFFAEMFQLHSPLGIVEKVRMSNISINSYNSILIQGMKKQPVREIFMENIFFNVSGPFDFKLRKKPKGFADSKFLYHADHRLQEFAVSNSYVTLANISGAYINNIFVYIPGDVYQLVPRNALALYNVQKERIGYVYRSVDMSEKETPVVAKY